MDRIINIIRKLCITFSWGFFGGLGSIILVIAANLNIPSDGTAFLIYSNRWWWPLATLLDKDPAISVMFWIGILSIIIGGCFHFLINWIFEK